MVYEEYMDNGLLTMDDLARMKRIIRGRKVRVPIQMMPCMGYGTGMGYRTGM